MSTCCRGHAVIRNRRVMSTCLPPYRDGSVKGAGKGKVSESIAGPVKLAARWIITLWKTIKDSLLRKFWYPYIPIPVFVTSKLMAWLSGQILIVETLRSIRSFSVNFMAFLTRLTRIFRILPESLMILFKTDLSIRTLNVIFFAWAAEISKSLITGIAFSRRMLS